MSAIEVRIDDDYYIMPDTTGYVLVKHGIGHRAKTNEEFISRIDIGYFYTISDCMKGYVREIEKNAVLDGAVSDVRDFLDILSRKEESLRTTALTVANRAFCEAEGADAR